MKRSKSVTLVLMGSAALALSGCGEDAPPSPVVYAGIEQCIQAGNPVETCAAEYKAAIEKNAAEAPRFATREECETGADANCQPTRVQNQDGSFSDVFVPLMAGYIISEAIDEVGDALERRDRRRTSVPVYGSRTQGGSYRTSTDYGSLRSSTALSARPAGSAAVRAPSQRPAAKALPAPNIKTSTISRGGFGGFSGGKSSGG